MDKEKGETNIEVKTFFDEIIEKIKKNEFLLKNLIGRIF